MILWTKRALKDFDRLPEKLQDRAEAVLEEVDQNPAAGTKLRGKLLGKWSARLGRAHRILYSIQDGDVIVLTIAPRRDVYR